MYTNKYHVADYEMRATASATIAEAVSTFRNMRDVDKLYLKVGVASSHPHYTDRGPTLNINIYMPTDTIEGSRIDAPSAVTTSFAINLGTNPSTAKALVYDITGLALGDLAVGHSLTEGVGGATARATYSIDLVGKGNH